VSTFQCPVVEITKWGKHPAADTLSLCQVFGQTIAFRTQDFTPEGTKSFRAIYLPEESLVPEDPRWTFLWANRTKQGKPMREVDRVVKAIKLRGIFSCGLLVPAPEDVPVGTDMAPSLGIVKYEAPEQVGTGGDNASRPDWLPTFTEIESAKGPLYKDQPAARHEVFDFCGQDVIISEKIHGSNGRYVYHDGQFYVGSHHNVKAVTGTNIWTYAAQHQDLERICRNDPGFVFFGEVYGPVQKGYDYGKKVPTFVLFDIFDLANRQYMNWGAVLLIAEDVGLPVVPLLYQGPWKGIEHAESLADGPSLLGGKNNREGCVVRTAEERWNSLIGRSVLKVIGQDYLLKKYS
jgi:RNA ligase (TIGR02306 family)